MNNYMGITNCFLAAASIWIIRKYLGIYFEKKNNVIWKILVWGLYFFVQLLLTDAEGINPIVKVLLNIGMVLIVCIRVYTGDLGKKILYSVMIIIIWVIVEMFISYLFIILPKNYDTNLVFGAILSKVVITIFVIFFSFYSKPKESRRISLKYWVILFMVPLSSLFIANNIYILNKTSETETLLSIVSFALILLINLIIFEVYDRLSENMEIQKINAVCEQQLQLMEKHAEEREEFMQSEKVIRHNLKNQYAYLKKIIEKDNKQEALDFLNELFEEPNDQKLKIARSGNAIVDTLLNNKYSIAKKAEINFNVNLFIPHKLPFKEKDLCIILGNSLDNAVEASKLCEDKFIDVYIVCKKEALSIVIKNSYCGKLKKDSKGTLLSTKKDIKNHGIGLISIRKIVDSYDGEIVIKTDNNIFCLTILLDM